MADLGHTDEALVEELATALWRADAERAAPNVAKMRTPAAFADLSERDREVWMFAARAILPILKRELAKAKADVEMLAGALEGFVAELTSNMTNRSKMLTINHAALVRRIAHAHEALAALKEKN